MDPREPEPQIVDCVHADRCAGCSLIDEPLASQLEQKADRLAGAIDAYPVLRGVAREPIVAAPLLTRYRTRTKLMVDVHGRVGLFARGTHDVVDIPHCRVMPPLTQAAIAAMRPFLPGSGIEAIDVREVRDGAEQGLLVTLIAAAGSMPAARACATQVARVEGVRTVAVSTRDRDAVQLLGRDLAVCHGPTYVRDRVHDSAPFVRATPGAFVQVHRDQAHRLQGHVIAAIEHALGTVRGKRVVELHCGEGGLGLRLAQLGADMLMIDSFEPAVLNVRAAAREQGLSVEAWAIDATEAMARLIERGQTIDAVLIDPPRRGIPPALRRRLRALGADLIAYVSCAPETFARDLAHLRWLGYGLASITPFDMIPLSAEVESVGLLRLSAASDTPRLTALYEDEQVVVVDKPAHIPATPQAEHAVSLTSLARVQFDAPGSVVSGAVDATTSGACVVVKRPEHVHAWTQALAAGESRHTALVRGVLRPHGRAGRTGRDDRRRRQEHVRFERQAMIGGHALITVTAGDGRTHRIRRELAAIGRPILGDGRYGDARSNRHMEHKHGLDRPFLHCDRLTLVAPTTGEVLAIDVPLAPDLAAALESLGSA